MLIDSNEQQEKEVSPVVTWSSIRFDNCASLLVFCVKYPIFKIELMLWLATIDNNIRAS